MILSRHLWCVKARVCEDTDWRWWLPSMYINTDCNNSQRLVLVVWRIWCWVDEFSQGESLSCQDCVDVTQLSKIRHLLRCFCDVQPPELILLVACTMALIATFIFLCGVRNEEEECEPPGGPRLHPDCARAGPGRSVRNRAEWTRQSAHCCAAKPVGQSRADNH